MSWGAIVKGKDEEEEEVGEWNIACVESAFEEKEWKKLNLMVNKMQKGFEELWERRSKHHNNNGGSHTGSSRSRSNSSGGDNNNNPNRIVNQVKALNEGFDRMDAAQSVQNAFNELLAYMTKPAHISRTFEVKMERNLHHSFQAMTNEGSDIQSILRHFENLNEDNDVSSRFFVLEQLRQDIELHKVKLGGVLSNAKRVLGCARCVFGAAETVGGELQREIDLYSASNSNNNSSNKGKRKGSGADKGDAVTANESGGGGGGKKVEDGEGGGKKVEDELGQQQNVVQKYVKGADVLKMIKRKFEIKNCDEFSRGLINTASADENLMKMYEGWSAWY